MRNATLLSFGALLMATPTVAIGAQGGAPARAARSLNGYDNARLHYVKASGNTLYEEGSATGALPGRVTAALHVSATFGGSFTIYTRYGQIRGNGSATPHPYRSGIESFSGTAYITGGTGRYAHAHGRGGMYGTYNQRNYEVVLQTRGTFSY
jgi:hypothetical protein